ncbi:MAG: bacteriorhodopsin, partial [Flavobacteriales bacterium]|nr:bacteriorhodopsin [Flavobacteriales bacterium]
LMCVEFYLILKVAGATKSDMWKLIGASTVMLVTGFFGESGWDGGILSAAMWGLLSGLAYFWIAYEVWFGGLKKLAVAAGGNVLEAHKMLCWFLLVGWAIYPLGYMAGTDGWYSGISAILPDMEVIYNIGDAVNKIGFGLVVYGLAVKES